MLKINWELEAAHASTQHTVAGGQHGHREIILLFEEVELDPKNVEVGHSPECARQNPILYFKSRGPEPDEGLKPRGEVDPIRGEKGPEGGGPPVGEHDEAMSPKLHEVKQCRDKVTRRGKALVS